jgi:hypothetical protein
MDDLKSASAPSSQSINNPIGSRTRCALGTLLVGAALLIAAVLTFHERLIDDVFKHVVDVSDGELPISVASFPSSPEIVSIIGGNGEGLNCSLPFLSDLLFDAGVDEDGRRRWLRQKFRQACVFHDLCYRHGLATYGYSQNDCDMILQDQASRLCSYLESRSSADRGHTSGDRCQREAKKVLAGVSLAGYGSYRGWDRSTFLEFDVNPIRSREFTVSRVLDHPFKAKYPGKYGADPGQVMLTFKLSRNNVNVRCANCPADNSPVILNQENSGVSEEFVDEGISARPEALRGRSLSMEENRTVWLPPGRHHAAPHLLLGSDGEHHLIWLSRSRIDDTGWCIVSTNARRLLTYTLPEVGGCNPKANRQLSPFDVEMYSSSALPMLVARGMQKDQLVTVGLSAQKDSSRNLHICSWRPNERDRASCRLMEGNLGRVGYQIGAFQNFPILRQGQAMYFAREIRTRAGYHFVSKVIDLIKGNRLSPEGHLLIVDIESATIGSSGLSPYQKVKDIKFEIADSYDPMVPLSSSKEDLRLVSLVATNNEAMIYQVDFGKMPVKPVGMKFVRDSEIFTLPKSWAGRPAIVAEPKGEIPDKIQLIFSRGGVLHAGAKQLDQAYVQFLVVERDVSAGDDVPWSYQRGATCKISYTLEKEDEDTACGRTYDKDRPMRASPAAMIRGAQLLVGRFKSKEVQAFALPDACFEQNPVVLSWAGDDVVEANQNETNSKRALLKKAAVSRNVDCRKLSLSEIKEPLN